MTAWLLRSLSALVAIAGVATVADALVVTDAERLDAYADELSADDPDARIDALLRRADLTRVSVEVIDGDGRDRFGDGDDAVLAARTRSLLSKLEAGDVRMVQRATAIAGDRATLTLGYQAGGERLDAQLQLVRRGDGFVLSRVRVL